MIRIQEVVCKRSQALGRCAGWDNGLAVWLDGVRLFWSFIGSRHQKECIGFQPSEAAGLALYTVRGSSRVSAGGAAGDIQTAVICLARNLGPANVLSGPSRDICVWCGCRLLWD